MKPRTKVEFRKEVCGFVTEPPLSISFTSACKWGSVSSTSSFSMGSRATFCFLAAKARRSAMRWGISGKGALLEFA